jgi:excisionase family DNA binding protein
MTKQHSEWVGLGEAAEILGVHPTTVRTWADKGELPSRRTPGGHRRFRRSDLEQWERAPTSEPAEAQVMVQSALGRTRMQVGGGQLADLPWYQHLNDETRQYHRTMGRELLTLLERYLTQPDVKANALAEVAQIGKQYGELVFQQGLTLSEATQAFLFFRDVLGDSVLQMAETLSLRTAQEWGEKLQTINHFTDIVLIALIESYEAQQNA